MNDFGLSGYRLHEEADLPSPALLVDRARMEGNLRRTLAVAGDVRRLRPHVKTHKMAGVLKAQLALGVRQFKCATLVEAEMCAREGAEDILLAYPPVGPSAGQLVQLAARHAGTRWSAITDTVSVARALSDAARAHDVTVGVWVDLDVGMHRTGVAPDASAEALYRELSVLPNLALRGLHAYDGHIRDSDPSARTQRCEEAFAPVLALVRRLSNAGFTPPTIVAGGSPTFAIHAGREGVECSPGTTVFWDAGYATQFPDLPYQPAALLMSRVVSKPLDDALCLDLGYKGVASESPHPRVIFPALGDVQAVSHSEEHLVLRGERAKRFNVGDVLYGVPWHVCPTVALYQEAVMVEAHRIVDTWPVTARHRRLQGM